MVDEWHRCAYLNDYRYIVSRLEINKSDDDDDDGARSVHNRVIRNVLSRPRSIEKNRRNELSTTW